MIALILHIHNTRCIKTIIYVQGGGESITQLLERCKSAFLRIGKKYKGSSILIISKIFLANPKTSFSYMILNIGT